MDKNILNLKEKYEDFWSKHNLTSRVSILLFVLVYIISVLFLYFTPVSPELATIILKTTGDIAMITILVVILGPNTVVKIAEIFSNKNKIDEKIDDLDDFDNSKIGKTPKIPKDFE